MHIAVEGCSHGELDTIYNAIQRLEQLHNFKVNLLLCCGDFQSVRNEQDLKCMACPVKYMEIHDFYQYHSGEKKAPVLTIFIGGNHEASNYLQELPYGGWVAPNIYYLGYAGVVRYGGLRIGGLSGIYKGHDFLKGRYEKSPYSNDSVRSVYHVRNLEVFRLKQLSGDHDVFMSHDWPRGVYHHGPKEKLMRKKRHFRAEIEANTLGSRPAEDLLHKLRPKYWFSGHLHVKFPAVVQHKDENSQKQKTTKFLALDKCLPRRDFLQVIEVPSTQALELKYDAEWLTILRLTNHLLCVNNRRVYMPGPGGSERYQFTPTQEEMEETLKLLGGDLKIPENFLPTAKSYNQNQGKPVMEYVEMPQSSFNPQTTTFCSKLGIDDPMALLLGNKRASQPSPKVTPPRHCLNRSEMNITFDTSKLSHTSVDEAEGSDDDDDDNGDILMEMKLTPQADGQSGTPEDIVMELKLTPKHNTSSINPIEDISPIKVGESPQLKLQPASSSPRPLVPRSERHGLRLSDPKQGDGSFLPFNVDSSASSSMSESESSPRRSPIAKRSNYENETEGTETSVSSSPSLSEGGKGMKKLKRRNQALYSSAEEDV